VLMMHNGHIQRVPMQLVPGVRSPSAGSYLAAELGPDYVAIGVTALEGHTTDGRLDDEAPCGIEVISRPLDPPAPDSIERVVADGVSEDESVLLDLRRARGTAGPTSIRHAYLHMPVDVIAAFDAIACLPTMSPSSFVLSD
jgi:erythromycin esterase